MVNSQVHVLDVLILSQLLECLQKDEYHLYQSENDTYYQALGGWLFPLSGKKDQQSYKFMWYYQGIIQIFTTPL